MENEQARFGSNKNSAGRSINVDIAPLKELVDGIFAIPTPTPTNAPTGKMETLRSLVDHLVQLVEEGQRKSQVSQEWFPQTTQEIRQLFAEHHEMQHAIHGLTRNHVETVLEYLELRRETAPTEIGSPVAGFFDLRTDKYEDTKSVVAELEAQNADMKRMINEIHDRTQRNERIQQIKISSLQDALSRMDWDDLRGLADDRSPIDLIANPFYHSDPLLTPPPPRPQPPSTTAAAAAAASASQSYCRTTHTGDDTRYANTRDTRYAPERPGRPVGYYYQRDDRGDNDPTRQCPKTGLERCPVLSSLPPSLVRVDERRAEAQRERSRWML